MKKKGNSHDCEKIIVKNELLIKDNYDLQTHDINSFKNDVET